jgi:gluconate 2-dehydrogenase subunit 3-like protein
MIGRYPTYDVFDAMDTWDIATRRLIEDRMRLTGAPFAFFSAAEQPTLRAFCDTCLAQDDEPRVPVAEAIDQKLAGGQLDGYRYDDMPDDRETWRLVLAGLDETAQRMHGVAGFAAAEEGARDEIVGLLADGKLAGGPWDQLNVSRAWSVCMRMILAGFYSHPWAWNEIGFGGPAYPRGFMRLGPVGTREPFEASAASDEDPVRVVQEGQI